MSSTIGDRLAAALEARAEQVTPEDLRPLEVPEPSRGARAGVLLLAAAVTAAVVATPFVLTRDAGTTPSPGPAGTPSGVVSPSEASPTPTESASPDGPSKVTAGGVVAGRRRADVDGDGRPDRVRLLTDGTSPDEPGENGLVEVSLAAAGDSWFAPVPGGYADLKPAFAVNRDGREQLLILHTQGGDAAQLLVYTWRDGKLVRATHDRDVPLGLEMGGERVLSDYYTSEAGLFSWRRTDLVSGTTYRVEQWRWTLEGDSLVPTKAAPGCVDLSTGEEPGPC